MDRNDWNARYSGPDLLWSETANRFVVAQLSALPAGAALDLGCGEGRNAVWLAERGWDVTGVDFSDAALHRARAMAEHHGVTVRWVEADLTSWSPPRAAFDLVVVAYIHLEAALRARVLAGAASALRPGGVLLAIGHDRSNLVDGYGGPRHPEILWTPAEVVSCIPGLEIALAERVVRPVDTPDGPRRAIDTLVRATAPGRGGPSTPRPDRGRRGPPGPRRGGRAR